MCNRIIEVNTMTKNFKLNEAMKNPALNYINQKETIQSKPQQDADTQQIELLEDRGTIKIVRIPKGMSIKDAFKENRTKRVQLVMQPSLFNNMKQHCKDNKQSVNDFINRLIEEALQK